MSVDFFLYRIPSDLSSSDSIEKFLPFGSQDEIIEHFSSEIGFELLSQDSPPNSRNWITFLYTYHHESNMGRVVEFSLEDDPVTCISINRAYPEDFWPVINTFNELSPFLIQGPDVKPINPDEFIYSFDDWIQKNYEANELSFSY